MRSPTSTTVGTAPEGAVDEHGHPSQRRVTTPEWLAIVVATASAGSATALGPCTVRESGEDERRLQH